MVKATDLPTEDPSARPGGPGRRWAGAASRAATRIVAWRWLLLVNLFFVSPVLLYNLELRSGGRLDTLGLWSLTMSVLLLGGVQLLARRPAPLLLAMLPLGLVVVADLFVVIEFDSRLNAAYLALIAHNVEEVGEFVEAFAPRLAAVLAVFLAFYGLCAWKLRGLELRAPAALGLAPLGLAACLYAAGMWASGREPGPALRHVMLRDTSSPFGIAPQLAIAYRTYRSALTAPETEAFRFGATRPLVAEPEVYVLVLGETCRPDHWGVNGYSRDTSPRLARLRGLVSFTDVVTQAATTRESVPLILTRGTADVPERVWREPSIIRAFAEAGFRTAWLSTQEVSEFTGRMHHIAAESDTVRFFERRHDEALVAPFEQLLGEVQGAGDKLLIVLHTMGNHSVYENRVPDGFRAFSRNPARSERESLVNAYDDTIRYTDHVLGELIERLEARTDVASALLFVSDHGENLMDDERRFRLHGQGTRYDLRTAAFFWSSRAYERLRPDAVACARARARAPLSTEAMFHSLADLAGLRGPSFDRSRSLFSPAFFPRPRLYLRDGELRDFERLVR